MASKYYFSTRDLVLIAVISSLGGVLSTYVGYLGNMLNNLFGVPFGAGQFMAGLHIFWIMLVYGLTKKKGTAILAGFLKGFVEFLTGGKLGILAVALTVFQAAIIDIAFLFISNPKAKMYALVGGISTGANILFFQLAFATYDAWPLFLALSAVAFISGVIFAGLFAKSVVDLIEEDKPLERSALNIKKVITIGLIFSLAFGAAYYQLGRPDGNVLNITGNVENELSIYYADYEDELMVVNTEMVGTYQYEP
nr:ECF transporter S component [Candidatus Methanofastidiosa archaeon]